MTLADSSALVEYLRSTDSRSHRAVREEVESGRLAVTEPVVMELLAGAPNEGAAAELQRFLAARRFVHVEGLGDHETAAELYRTCRRAGRTLRHQVDCLIAAVAIRSGVPLIHCDTDFDFIARHSPLEIYEPD